jgi:salicylate hydroxylase
VLGTSRTWGELWHLEGEKREIRNEILRQRSTHDYAFVDWLYGPTALSPEELSPMFSTVPVTRDSVDAMAAHHG